MVITIRINNCLVHGRDLCGCNKIVSSSRRFLIARVATSYIASLCISSQFYTPNKLLKFSQRSKSNYAHWRLFEWTSPVINIVVCSLFSIKNMINGSYYCWPRLASRHGRQPRLDQHRDVIRDVRFTVCAYWLPDYKVSLHNSLLFKKKIEF